MTTNNTTLSELNTLVAASSAAFVQYARSTAATRAALLRGLADALEAQRETLVPLADTETHLGSGRLNGELDRTAFQLR